MTLWGASCRTEFQAALRVGGLGVGRVLEQEEIFKSGSCRNLGVPYFGVLIIRILLFRVDYIGVPYFRKLPSIGTQRLLIYYDCGIESQKPYFTMVWF